MKSPKMLPWLAKKAGIPFPRAEELWLEAVSHATLNCAVGDSPEFWKAAIDHLTDGIAAESLARRIAPFAPLAGLPAQLWLHGLALQKNLAAIAANAMRRRCLRLNGCQ